MPTLVFLYDSIYFHAHIKYFVGHYRNSDMTLSTEPGCASVKYINQEPYVQIKNSF